MDHPGLSCGRYQIAGRRIFAANADRNCLCFIDLRVPSNFPNWQRIGDLLCRLLEVSKVIGS